MRTRSLVDGLIDDIAGLVDPALVDVTADPIEAQASIEAGRPAVLVSGPRITWLNPSQIEARFPVHVIAGHDESDLAAAWDDVDNVLDLLLDEFEGLDVDEAEPATMRHFQGRNFPAYTLTHTASYTL